ncbi:MAG: NUDIX hydrolase [Desulfobacterales bacterium]|nr:NUDIX hydrolase [Desulfobacterales bacterium]
MVKLLEELIPANSEVGVGLALKDDQEKYLFFLAGTRHCCAKGQIFYAGIGGHVEPGEDYLTCAHREAMEELGALIKLTSAKESWYIKHDGMIKQINTKIEPRPIALYEMIHPAKTPNQGKIYRIVIFSAHLLSFIQNMPLDEVRGVIALTEEQVIKNLERNPTISELVDEGASVITSDESLNFNLQIYPIGSAKAIAQILINNKTGKDQ